MSGIPHHTSDPMCPLCEHKLEAAHDILKDWFKTHVKPKYPDAHVSWAHRNKDDQERAFADGHTILHYPHSKHNQLPSLAIDLFEIDDSGAAVWNPKFFLDLNADTELLGVPILWGGRFKKIGDADHFELLSGSEMSECSPKLVDSQEKPNLV